MTRCALALVSWLSSCAALVPATPQVNAQRPELLQSGGASDPSRQPARLPGRPCVVACGPGFRCDERSAQCVADPLAPGGDGGVRWMP